MSVGQRLKTKASGVACSFGAENAIQESRLLGCCIPISLVDEFLRRSFWLRTVLFDRSSKSMAQQSSQGTILGPGFDVPGFTIMDDDPEMGDVDSTAESPLREEIGETEVVDERSQTHATLQSEGASPTSSVGGPDRPKNENHPDTMISRMSAQKMRSLKTSQNCLKPRHARRYASAGSGTPTRKEVGSAIQTLESGIGDTRAGLNVVATKIGEASSQANAAHEQLSRLEQKQEFRDRETAAMLEAVGQKVALDKQELLSGLHEVHVRDEERRAEIGALERKAHDDVNRLTANVAHVTHRAEASVEALSMDLQTVRQTAEGAHLKFHDISKLLAALQQDVCMLREDGSRHDTVVKMLSNRMDGIMQVTVPDLRMRMEQSTLDCRALKEQLSKREQEIKDLTRKLDVAEGNLSATRQDLEEEKERVTYLSEQQDAWRRQEISLEQQTSDLPHSDVTHVAMGSETSHNASPYSGMVPQDTKSSSGGNGGADDITLAGGISGQSGIGGNGGFNPNGGDGNGQGFGGNFPPPPMGQTLFTAQSHATPSTSSQFTLKLKDPPTFDGNPDKDVDTWLLSVNDCLAVAKTTEQEAVNYMAMLLVGNAKDWWHQYLREHHHVRPATVAQLSTAMREQFGSALREKRARADLRYIRIKPNESIRNYSARFSALLQKLPGHESAWALDQYINGLPPRVAEAVTLADAKTLTIAMRKAEEVELAHQWTHGQLGGSTNANQNRGRGAPRGKSSWRGSGHGFVPARGAGNGGLVGRIPLPWRGRGRQNQPRGGQSRGHGSCYICGKPDHWSNACPHRIGGHGRGRVGSQAARGRGRSVPSRTALNVALGSVAPEDEEVGTSGATAAADFSRESEN